MSQSNTKKIAKVEIRIPPEVKESFAHKCDVQGKTVSETLREWITDHLNDNSGNNNANNGLKTKALFGLFSVVIITIAMFGYYLLQKEEVNPVDIKLVTQFNKYDVDHNGVLTLNDFSLLKQKKVARFKAQKGNAFNEFNADNTPKLVSIAQMESKMKPKRALARFDLNKDGLVPFEEFIASKPKVNYIKWPPFETLDHNNDQLISKDELLDYSQQWNIGRKKGDKRANFQANARLYRYDSNKDGVLSKIEFTQKLKAANVK